MRRQLVIGLVFAFAGTAACGDRDVGSGDSLAGKLDSGAPREGMMRDGDVFASLTASNASEVTIGQLAETKALNAEVKAFAKMMVTDHNALNASVHEVAQQLNLTSQVGDKTEDVVDDSKEWTDELKNKTGGEFDQKFMDIMVDSHEKTLKLLDKLETSTSTAKLTATIMTARPRVQAHLDQARQLRDKLGKQ